MTQTTPSHSQAVEAAPHRDQDGTYFLKYEGDEQIYDVAMRNSPLAKAIDAYVTSQQEVAAPVGDDEDDAALSLRHHIQYCDRNIAAWREKGNEEQVLWWENWKAEVERRELAASRVPVASLASREQGVEAVGAVPVGHFIENFGETGRWQQSKNEMPGITCPLYKAPPSSKTQDDLAGADNWTPEEIDAVICCLDDDAAAMLNENDEDERAHNMQRAATMIQVFSDLASQPKAPAPVPVVQGEAMNQFTNEAAFKNFHRNLCERFGYTHDDKFWWRDLVSLIEHITTSAPEHPTTGSGQGDKQLLDAIEQNMWFVEPQYQEQGSWRVGKADKRGRAAHAGKSLRKAIRAAILSTASPAGAGEGKS